MGYVQLGGCGDRTRWGMFNVVLEAIPAVDSVLGFLACVTEECKNEAAVLSSLRCLPGC